MCQLENLFHLKSFVSFQMFSYSSNYSLLSSSKEKMDGNYKANEEYVISGISGRFPECENIEEFKKNLYEGVDLITDDERRWPSGTYGLPDRTGKLKDIKYFDATFFGISAKQTEVLDPHIRLLLELTHEAIIDAGVNPSELKGSKTGVFIGVSGSANEADYFWNMDPDTVNGYGALGCCRNMFANRISFAFDFNGPSYVIDAACASTLYAVQQAIAAMKLSHCDSAIIGGVHLLMNPISNLQLNCLHMLNREGKCRAFDESANGYVRSEGAVIIYLQKSSVAKRIYATVVGAKTNNGGIKSLGITYPVGSIQNKLIREIYQELNIDPAKVVYVEAHGTGTQVGDLQEVNSISDAFCKDRKSPLLIGSVKSNMGHSEPTSGLCSVAKMIIAMETGVIPQNLHYKNPNPKIPALVDGRIKVVDKNLPWNGGYVGINSFGFGGSNAHVVLKSNSRPKNNNYVSKIPNIYFVSGRTLEAVDYFLDKIDGTPNDVEMMALIHDIHKQNIPGHNYRGYSLIGNQVIRETGPVGSENRPVWFIYSGMGGQWSKMGCDMMQLPVFKVAIKKCADILKPLGIDLEDLILKEDPAMFDNVNNSFIAITAMQIALTDTITSLGIQPDGIIGHSIGEVSCAYADGSLTVEQTILTAFSRGKAILQSNTSDGAMASVGLTWEECKTRCPQGIYPVCHNSQNNVTVSGPSANIQEFVKELTTQNIFARIVNSSGQAFHSKYISDAGPRLKKALDEIIPDPKPRSQKWISSSIPESEWNTPIAQLSSSDYHVHNLLSPVLFHEAVKYIPENAIVIEIAPHCLLQAVLRRSLGSNCSYIGLMKKNHTNSLAFFMSSLGKLYITGTHPNVAGLYPPVSYPVSRGTPMLQSMIKWDHSVEWPVPSFPSKNSRQEEMVIEINLSKKEDQYLAGHCIGGRILFPISAYIMLVWKTLAKSLNKNFEQLSVIFENVHFHRATILQKEGVVKLSVNILASSGNFEICEGDTLVVSGRVDVAKEILEPPKSKLIQNDEFLKLTSTDIYKEFRLRGSDYDGIFKGIIETDNHFNVGLLKWDENWITFISTMIQFYILKQNVRDVCLVTGLERVVINSKQHLDYISQYQGENRQIFVHRNGNLVESGGIKIQGLDVTYSPKRQKMEKTPKLERYVNVPYENDQSLCDDSEKSKIQSLIVLLQTFIENCSFEPKILELAEDGPTESIFAADILKILESEPAVFGIEYKIMTKDVEPFQNVFESIKATVVQNDITKTPIDNNVHLVVAKNLIGQKKIDIIKNCLQSLQQNGFILIEETLGNVDDTLLLQFELELVSKQVAGPKMYLLLRKSIEITSNYLIIQVTGQKFSWVESVKHALKKSESDGTKIYLVAQNEELCGLMGLTTCIVREPGGENVRSIFIQDKTSEKFSITSSFFIKQMKKDLVFNVLKNGIWGTFRHILLDNSIDNSLVKVEEAYIDAITEDLTSFKWIQRPPTYHKCIKSGTEPYSVYYAPLNYFDLLSASGKLPRKNMTGQNGILGIEFSGRDNQGRRIMGMVAAGSIATTVFADPDLVWEIPDKWSMEEACTIPVAYGMSYYALVIRGQIKPGETVLIHQGTKDVSQAAISIALNMGCIVFTTIENSTQSDSIKKRFPQLRDNNIGHSSDSFNQMILEQTKYQGVDIVLNLKSDNLQASLKCLAKYGRILELVRTQHLDRNVPVMELITKNITFHGNLLNDLFDANSDIKKEVQRLVSEGIKQGIVHIIPTKIFHENQIGEAFRTMVTGDHNGKIIIKIRDEESHKPQKPATKLVSAMPRTYMNPDKSYILVGGLGGFGLELTDFLITRGANKIVLNSRRGIRTGYQSLCIRRWREMGITVVINTADVTTELGTKKLLEESNKLGSIGGIFNLAVVLRDAMMENQSEENFKIVCGPKVNATRNLDNFSRVMCPNLDHFIAFSSASCARGNRGQVNYGYANSALERISEARKTAGFPGLAIQWSVIGDVGITMETIGGNDTKIIGNLPQKITSCLQTIDYFMQQPDPVLATSVVAEKRTNNVRNNNLSPSNDVASILGIKDSKSVSPNLSLTDLGMDSIMSSEIKQVLKRDYNFNLDAEKIRALTFAKLTEIGLRNK